MRGRRSVTSADAEQPGLTTWDALVGQARLALVGGCAVLMCLTIVDSRVLAPDIGLIAVLGLRIGLALAGLAIGWTTCGAPAPGRLRRQLLWWQAGLVLQHVATVWLWPMGLASHVAALATLLLVYFLFPSTPRRSLALGLSLTALHLLPLMWDFVAPPAEILLAGLAANAVGYAARLREREWRALAGAIDAAEGRMAAAIAERDRERALLDAIRQTHRTELMALLRALPTPLIVLDQGGGEIGRSAGAADLLSDIPADMVAALLGALPQAGTVERVVTPPAGHARTLVATVNGVSLGGRALRLVALAEATRLRSTESALAEARRAAELTVSRDRRDQAELAHDLRTPLNGIFGFTQLLQDTPLSDGQRDHVARIMASAEDMLRAIDVHLGVAPQEAPPPATRPAQGLSVLLVEDDEVSGLLARTLLERDGHSVTLATNGRDAVAQAAKGGFDVVLMDIRLPVFGGPAATRRIRALRDKAAAAVPIVAMTANVLPSQMERYRAAGMQAAVAKPVDRDRLRAVLAEVMAGRAGALAEAGFPAAAPPPAVPAEPAALDRSVLDGHLAVLGPQRLAHVVESFLRAAPATLSAIRDAMADHDLTALAKAAHKLGSGALTVGLAPLGALCRETERLAVAGDDGAALDRAAALERAFAPAVAALEAYLRDRAPGRQTTSAPSL